MTKVQIFYLVAAIVGTVLPWMDFLPFCQGVGFSPPEILRALYTNGATSGLSNDFFITCVVLWVFAYIDSRQSGVKRWWFVIPAAPLIGLSMALPAYLFLRERSRLAKC